MNKKLKIFLWIILILVVVIIACTVYVWIFSTCCGPKVAPTPSRLDDPDLVYASRYWAGMCGNGKGETGGCYSEMYLYGSGKFVKESGFVRYDAKRDVVPTVERNFTAVIVEQIINKIKNSGVMEKDCPPSQIMDAGWDYQVNIDGVKKSFHNPPPVCRDNFDQVDNLIDGITNYKE